MIGFQTWKLGVSRRMGCAELASDIRARIVADFGAESLFQVAAELARYTGAEGDRVRRCILYLASGSRAALRENVHLANVDYRDVIWSAEYDGGKDRLRNFSKPFPNDC